MNIVERIDEEIEKRSMLKHPFYRMWSEGKLTIDHLQGYSKEYFQLVKAVPVMVDSISDSCDPSVESSIASNSMEEKHHVGLWIRFAKSLGVQEIELQREGYATKTSEAVNTLIELCRLPLEQAASAMYAFEAELPKISRSKIEGLKKFYDMTNEESTKYFETHEEADVRHAQVWREIILAAPSDKHAGMIQAATRSLEAQNKLLDSVQEKYIGMYC